MRRGKAYVELCLLAAAFMLVPPGATAQQAVRLVVPFQAGGAHDTLARLVAPVLSNQLKQSVIVENKPGAGGVIGLEYITTALPDGMTVLVGSGNVMAAIPATDVVLKQDSRVINLVNQAVPVSLIGKVGAIICVTPSLPIQSFAEMIAYAKANPNKLFYGTVGVGGTAQLTMELLAQQAGIKLTAVAYKGQPPAAQDLIAGHIQLMLLNYETAAPMIQSGKVRPLAIASPARHPDYPDLPTVAESGFPGFQADLWTALFLPPKSSQAVIDRLHAAVVATMASPELRKQIENAKIQPVTSTPEELAALIREDFGKWSRAAKQAQAASN
ncbi:MAG: Bug family tripartite tricarboxylate transporter substrate binding protein [Lautropia sp.]